MTKRKSPIAKLKAKWVNKPVSGSPPGTLAATDWFEVFRHSVWLFVVSIATVGLEAVVSGFNVVADQLDTHWLPAVNVKTMGGLGVFFIISVVIKILRLVFSNTKP